MPAHSVLHGRGTAKLLSLHEDDADQGFEDENLQESHDHNPDDTEQDEDQIDDYLCALADNGRSYSDNQDLKNKVPPNLYYGQMKPPCHAFIAGNCTRADCKFEHNSGIF